MPDSIPTEASPLTCEYCENTAATEVFSADVFKLGRHTTFCCPACGDEQEFHVRRLGGQLWRFRIVPREAEPIGWIVLEHHPAGILPSKDIISDSREAAHRDCDQANEEAESAGVPTSYSVAALIEEERCA